MKQEEFIKNIHRRLASIAVGGSALRNQGASGLVSTARNYFEKSIFLEEFFKNLQSENEFQDYLNKHTCILKMEFPEGAQNWGASRKSLNLFFRELVYNKFIYEYYKIPIGLNDFNKVIRHLEVPLDLDVSTGIFKDFKILELNNNLKKWKSIKELTFDTSSLYQNAALKIADDKKIARVHLDLIYWRQ